MNEYSVTVSIHGAEYSKEIFLLRDDASHAFSTTVRDFLQKRAPMMHIDAKAAILNHADQARQPENKRLYVQIAQWKVEFHEYEKE